MTTTSTGESKLTKAQTRALEIIGDGRKSAGHWNSTGISYKTLNDLYELGFLMRDSYGCSKPSKSVYWRTED